MTKKERLETIKLSTYMSYHTMLRYHYGKADKCENPNCTGKSKFYTYALIKGRKYSRNRNDYIQLCRSCHGKYDFTEKSRLNLKEKALGNKWATKIIRQYDKKGNFIKEWESVTKASNQLGIIRTSISNNLIGISNFAGNFIFKYADNAIK